MSNRVTFNLKGIQSLIEGFRLKANLIIFTLLLILLAVTSPVKAADDKSTTPDVTTGGTLLRISLANSSTADGKATRLMCRRQALAGTPDRCR